MAAVEAQAAISHVKLEGHRTRKQVDFIQGARHAIDVGPQYVQLSVLAIESQTTRKQAAALKAQAEVQNLCDRRGAEVQPVEKRVAAARVIGDRIETAIGGVEGKAAKESHSGAEGCGQRARAAQGKRFQSRVPRIVIRHDVEAAVGGTIGQTSVEAQGAAEIE